MNMLLRWLRGLPPTREPVYVYRLYGPLGRLLYVGISNDPTARVRTHRRTQPWRWRIFWVRTRRYPDRDAAHAAERRAIRQERPRYNKLRYRGDGHAQARR